MVKIEFWLKKPSENQGNLEYITIGAPKIDKAKTSLVHFYYVSEVYLSPAQPKIYPISGINPADTLLLASNFAKTYLQALIKRGYSISDSKDSELWNLEKLSDNFLKEEINKIKNNPNISQEDKQKIFEILKESFGKTIIGDQLDKIIR